MATKPARITRTEQDEIRRIQKNFRAKFNRLVKQGIDRSMLPTLDTAYISGNETRAELNRAKAEMRAFTNRANMKYQFITFQSDKGQVTAMTKSENLRIEMARDRVNRLEKEQFRRNQKANYRVISEERAGKKGAARTVGQDRRKNEPLEYTKKDFKSAEEKRQYAEKLKRATERLNTANQRFKDNLKKAVTNKFGPEQAEQILAYIDKIPPDKLAYLYDTTDTLNFDYVYEHDTNNVATETALSDLQYVLAQYIK